MPRDRDRNGNKAIFEFFKNLLTRIEKLEDSHPQNPDKLKGRELLDEISEFMGVDD